MVSKQAPETDPLKVVATVKEGLTGAYGLARALPRFIREKITVKQAEEEIRRSLERREETFLELARRRIYGNPGSPYLKLLEIAGCEFADLQAQVRRDGLETTLERLAKQGVYLTSDEFKGKKEVLRGGESFWISPVDFRRREPAAGLPTQSSGSSSRAVRGTAPLDWLALHVPAIGVFFSAHDFFAAAHGMYDAILPGSGGMNNLLIYARLGISTDRWFARKVPASSRLEGGYHYLTTYLIVFMGKWFGPGFPRPEFMDIGDAHRIVRWVTEKRRRAKRCCITTAASNAARIARTAWGYGGVSCRRKIYR